MFAALGVTVLVGCKDKDKSPTPSVIHGKEVELPKAPSSDAQPQGVTLRVDSDATYEDVYPEILAIHEGVSKRLEPRYGLNPTHATVRLIRKIGEGDWKLAPMISPDEGLILIEDLDGPEIQRRVCGEELKQVIEIARLAFSTVTEQIEYEGAESLTCSNQPGPPTCISSELGHQGAHVFRFEPSASGLYLTGVFRLALGALGELEGAALETFRAEQLAKAEKAYARLRATPCTR